MYGAIYEGVPTCAHIFGIKRTDIGSITINTGPIVAIIDN